MTARDIRLEIAAELERRHQALLIENARLRGALDWLEDKAREGRLEIAPSLLATGFYFGIWPKSGPIDARAVKAATLFEAVEVAAIEEHRKVGALQRLADRLMGRNAAAGGEA